MIPLQQLGVPLFICKGELRELLGFLITFNIFSYMTSIEHDTTSYTCICVRASRRRMWGFLHLDGFAVICLAMEVTRWREWHHSSTTYICTGGVLSISSAEPQIRLLWDVERGSW